LDDLRLQVADQAHPRLDVQSGHLLRCLHLPRWSSHPNQSPDPTERNTPISGSKSVLKPSGPTAMWVGIAKDASCLEGPRVFLDFSSHDDILGRDGKSEAYRFLASNLHASWLLLTPLVDRSKGT